MCAAMAAIVLTVPFAQRAFAQSAEQIWANNCIVCHGRRGEGGGAGTRSLLTPEWRKQDHDRAFFDAIRNGVPASGMPAFGATLSDAQVWGLVVHLRELQARDYRENGGAPEVDSKGVYTSAHHRYTIETVIPKGVDLPWAVDWLPSGEMLVTSRHGSMHVFKDGRLSGPISGIPEVRDRGQGGLMDVAVHPDYAKNGHIFLAYSDIGTQKRGAGMTKIVRGKLGRAGDGWAWTDQKTIWEAKQEHYLNTDLHFGCRIVFDPKDPSILYFAIGERGMSDHAQDLARPNGKVHRVTIDGGIPSGNPFADRGTAYASIWSFGHRNPQGLVFDLDGRLWDTEHGPRGGDEVNLIERGRNYGWPLVSYGIDYSGAPFRTPFPDLLKSQPKDGAPIAMPVFRWLPSIGACGLDVVRGDAFPKWKGDLVAGGLSGANVDRIRVTPGAKGQPALVEHEEILYGKGRVRDVVTGPDGMIYVVLNAPDRVVRLVPAGS